MIIRVQELNYPDTFTPFCKEVLFPALSCHISLKRRQKDFEITY